MGLTLPWVHVRVDTVLCDAVVAVDAVDAVDAVSLVANRELGTMIM